VSSDGGVSGHTLAKAHCPVGGCPGHGWTDGQCSNVGQGPLPGGRLSRPRVDRRPVLDAVAVGEDRSDHREDHVDGRPDQADHQKRAHQMMSREATLGRHVAQLVQRDDDRGHRELAVDEVEEMEAERARGRDQSAHEPGRFAQRMIGGGHVLVEHRRPRLRGDEQPGVTGLAAGHQQQGQADSLQQQEPLLAGAPGDGDDRTAQDHPQRAVPEGVAVGHLDVARPSHQHEDGVDAESTTSRDEPLPPREHHHHQTHAGVEEETRFRGQYHLLHLGREWPRQAVVARGDLQREEESEHHCTRRGPQQRPRPPPGGGGKTGSCSREQPRFSGYQLAGRFFRCGLVRSLFVLDGMAFR